MKIGDRLFPYPVLCPGHSDYEAGIFEAECPDPPSDGLETLEIDVRIRLECPAIQSLIAAGDAHYALHLECAQSCYRVLIDSGGSPSFRHSVQLSKVQGALETVAFVLAARDIRGYTSDDFKPDFSGISFDIPKGSILAYENLPVIDIDRPLESVWGGKPIFIAHKLVGSGDAPMVVDMNRESIMIGLSSSDFERYARFARNPNAQPLLNAALVFPALVFVLDSLALAEDLDDYRSFEWFQALAERYERRGKSFEAILTDEDAPISSLMLAQELMEHPVGDAFSALLGFETTLPDEEEEE